MIISDLNYLEEIAEITSVIGGVTLQSSVTRTLTSPNGLITSNSTTKASVTSSAPPSSLLISPVPDDTIGLLSALSLV